jgi:hypothetical protein
MDLMSGAHTVLHLRLLPASHRVSHTGANGLPDSAADAGVHVRAHSRRRSASDSRSDARAAAVHVHAVEQHRQLRRAVRTGRQSTTGVVACVVRSCADRTCRRAQRRILRAPVRRRSSCRARARRATACTRPGPGALREFPPVSRDTSRAVSTTATRRAARRAR